MKLWILRPINGVKNWTPWYDKAFGFVVRAETEEEARKLATEQHGDEEPESWLDSTYSTCDELNAAGNAGIILRDFAAA